jgi:hypothetical protein
METGILRKKGRMQFAPTYHLTSKTKTFSNIREFQKSLKSVIQTLYLPEILSGAY